MSKDPPWLRYVRWNEGEPGPFLASASNLDAGSVESSPVVSVIVPTKNRARYLRATIDSILTQDYPAIECIVVDGASVDDSIQILKSYGERIRWVSEPDSGPFDAINKGWEMASGSVLAWLNADDMYMPGAVRCAVSFLESHPDVGLVHGACGLTDEEGNLQFLMAAPRWDLDVAFEHCEHFIYQPTAFVRKSAVDRAGNGVCAEWSHDYDLWFRIALTGGLIEETNIHLANARRDQPENDEGLPARYGPAMVSMIRRLSARPDLPPRLQVKRRRALSNAHARRVRYVRLRYPRHWLLALKSMARTASIDPANVPGIVRDSLIVLGWQYSAIAVLERALSSAVQAFKRLFLQLGSPRLWNPTTLALTAMTIQLWAILKLLGQRPDSSGTIS